VQARGVKEGLNGKNLNQSKEVWLGEVVGYFVRKRKGGAPVGRRAQIASKRGVQGGPSPVLAHTPKRPKKVKTHAQRPRLAKPEKKTVPHFQEKGSNRTNTSEEFERVRPKQT